MRRKRLTRRDSRELTTRRLLLAARRIIARKGLEAASVENITAAAGYSRGAFYANFNSKGDLFLELLRRDHERTKVNFKALLSDRLSLEQLQARVGEIYGHLYGDAESFMNWAEARMLAARDGKFRAQLNALLADRRQHLVEFGEDFYRRLGVALKVPPAVMIMGLMSLIEGVGLSMLSSPDDMSAAGAESLLAFFVDSIMQRARPPAEGAARDRRP